MKLRKSSIARRLFVVALTGILILGMRLHPRPAAAGASAPVDSLPACPRAPYSELSVSPFFGEDGLMFFDDNYSGILWKSSDGGDHWEVALRIQDSYPNAGVGPVIVAPIHSGTQRTVYAGAAFSYYGNILYAFLRSVDSGETWNIYQMCDESLAYCRNWVKTVFTNQPDVWFVPRVESYLFVEEDIQRWEGGDWRPRFTIWDETGATDLSVSPNFAADQLVYASLWPASPTLQTNLIRSSDGGDTWQNGLTEGLCPAEIITTQFSPTFASDRTIFAVLDGAVFKSADAGGAWQHVYPPDGEACQPSPPETYVWKLQVSPHYAQDQSLYVVNEHDDPFESYLYGSADGGQSWQMVLRVDGHLSRLIVAANPPSFHSNRTLITGALRSMGLPTIDGRSSPTQGNRLFLPLVGARGPEPRPLTLFARQAAPGTLESSYYRSDDGGVTWRCLALPVQS